MGAVRPPDFAATPARLGSAYSHNPKLQACARTSSLSPSRCYRLLPERLVGTGNDPFIATGPCSSNRRECIPGGCLTPPPGYECNEHSTALGNQVSVRQGPGDRPRGATRQAGAPRAGPSLCPLPGCPPPALPQSRVELSLPL